MTIRPFPLAAYTCVCIYLGSMLTTWSLGRYGITTHMKRREAA